MQHFLKSHIANDRKPVDVQYHQQKQQAIEQAVQIRLEAQNLLHLKAAAHQSEVIDSRSDI